MRLDPPSPHRTVELCPQFTAEVDPLRQRVAQTVFNARVEAFNRQDTPTALAQWATSATLSDCFPQAVFNQAVSNQAVSTQAGMTRRVPRRRTAPRWPRWTA